MKVTYLPILGAMLLAGPLLSQSPELTWSQFRGPGGQGIATGKVPTEWGAEKNILWKQEMPGPGASSPIVVGDAIYLTCWTGYNVPRTERGNMDDLRLHLLCFDFKTGKERWKTTVEPKLPEQETIRDEHGYATSTPVSDGKRLYVFFGKTGVFAFDLNGKKLWQADVGSGLNGWGSAASPIVWQNLVIVNASVESESMYALDAETGKEIWRARGIKEAWNTPHLAVLNAKEAEVIVGTPGKVLGFDAATGKQLWSCANDITWYIVPTIVQHGDKIWSLGGRSGTTAVAFKRGGTGDITKTHRMWTSNIGSNVTSPIYYDGYLYWMNDNRETAYCADAEKGKLQYEEQIPRGGQIYGSPVLVDGKIYYPNRTGKVFVVAAKPKFELLATNDFNDRSAFNASPAVAHNRLLVRSNNFLYCIGAD
ncbi:MAG: PQQ-binding-like beta-propeller repeat protein [Zavarzinella sp.]